jgi:hypothetical protein
MCSRYTYTKIEAKLRLRDLILVFGAVPRADIRPTDLGPVIVPEHDGFACRELHWGWGVPWDKSPLINAKSETLGIDERRSARICTSVVCCWRMDFMRKTSCSGNRTGRRFVWPDFGARKRASKNIPCSPRRPTSRCRLIITGCR